MKSFSDKDFEILATHSLCKVFRQRLNLANNSSMRRVFMEVNTTATHGFMEVFTPNRIIAWRYPRLKECFQTKTTHGLWKVFRQRLPTAYEKFLDKDFEILATHSQVLRQRVWNKHWVGFDLIAGKDYQQLKPSLKTESNRPKIEFLSTHSLWKVFKMKSMNWM